MGLLSAPKTAYFTSSKLQLVCWHFLEILFKNCLLPTSSMSMMKKSQRQKISIYISLQIIIKIVLNLKKTHKDVQRTFKMWIKILNFT